MAEQKERKKVPIEETEKESDCASSEHQQEKKEKDDFETIEAELVEEAEEDQEGKQEVAKKKEAPSEPAAISSEQDRLLRLQADFANYKRRAEKDRQDTIKYANEKLLLELIEVVDNFHLALESEKEEDAFYKGMTLIFSQLQKVLTDHGVEEIASDGAAFDPNFHDAVLSEPSEEVPSGHVIATMRRGYTLNGRLIRPAMVKVAQ